jgi:hypothetical protein
VLALQCRLTTYLSQELLPSNLPLCQIQPHWTYHLSTTSFHYTKLPHHTPIITHVCPNNFSFYKHPQFHHIHLYIYIHIQHHVILPYINFNHLNIILNSTLHNSIINKYLHQNSITIYSQDSSTSIYPYNLQSNISQTHSHLFSCIFLHYLVITFSFTIQISCILQYQFINIYHIHNINLVRYSISIQPHAIIRNTNLMHPSTSIH